MSISIILLIQVCLIYFSESRNCTVRDSSIKSLPGLTDVPCMYSGFVEIDEKTKTNLFYWLIEAKENSNSSPLIIWLNGGPGSSSLFGLFTEMGPLRLVSNQKLSLDEKKSWTSMANVLYVDQPVGTGYSFTSDINSIPNSQEGVSIHFYKFIQKFMNEYKEYSKKQIYIIGESYAGKYIPNIAKKILDENELIDKDKSLNIKIDLKKISIGNGLFDAKFQRAARKDLAKGINILSEHSDETQYDMLVKNCEFSVANNFSDSLSQCDGVLDFIMDLAGDVFEYDVRKSRTNDKDLLSALDEFLNLEEVVSSLHVKTRTLKPRPYWSLKNETVKQALKNDINLKSSIPVIEDLLDNYNLPIVLYAGQFDLVDGPQGIERSLYSMNYKNSEKFKKSNKELWKIKTDEGSIVAGYVKQFEKLVFIAMRNAGHYAPRDRIGSSLDLLLHLFSEDTQWKCPDDSCTLVPKKCTAMKNCHNNGICNESTAGLCVCSNEFYGPDCSLKALEIDNSIIRMSPRDTKVFKLSHYEGDMLLEIDSDDHNIIVSLLNKTDHEHIFNQKEHVITYRLIDHKLVLFIEKKKFDDYLVVITNQEFEHEIELKIYLNSYNFQKNTFWGPGGFGFFLGIFSFAVGIALFVATLYIYRRYRQEKVNGLMDNIGGDGYRIMNKT